MGPHQLSPMFDPRSVAVFGASERESIAGRVLKNLIAGGFEAPVFALNPKHESVLGRPCYRSLADLPGPVELAVIATPARTFSAILDQCAAAGVRHAMIVTAELDEPGAGAGRIECKAVETARRHGIRLLGPDCVALVRPWRRMNASAMTAETPAGKLALVSQSGALCAAISDWAGPNHLGFSALVALGTSVDIDVSDVLSFLANDQQTEAILVYVEGVRHARSFISEMRAAARIKPVVVLKGGRYHQSPGAADTHTGALVGSNAAFDAALERAGAVRARAFGQLFAAAEMLSAHRRAGGDRICIVTNGGGAGVLAADAARDLGLNLPAPSAATREALDKLLPAGRSLRNPIDIGGEAPPEAFGRATAACLADPGFDGVLVMLTPQAMTQPVDCAREVLAAQRAGGRKPVLACWMGQASVAAARELLSSSGLPDFTTPERAVEAFSHLAAHERNRRLSLELPGSQLFSAGCDLSGARMILEEALAAGRSMLSDTESKAILRAFGIPTVATVEADTPAKALIAAQTLGFPVVLKVNSPQITHKSDVGGVRTGIAAAAEVHPAFVEMTAAVRAARPDAEILGVTVEKMAGMAQARELLVGVVRDPVFGPVIAFGAGGTKAELVDDAAVALPPLTSVLAERLIDKTRVSRQLEAHRNAPAANRGALAAVLLRVSDMVSELPEIVELDINPLFAGPEGVLAVDARIAIARPTGTGDPYGHLAIAPYPRHLVEHAILADGRALTLRPIRPEDAEREQAFVRGLSPEARRLRFLQAIKELSPAMLAQFTQIDYAREMALVATVETEGVEEQVGVARYIINPDGRSCEFAIVVGDKLRGQGIGSRLMNALIGAARAQGLSTMVGVVLAENAPMLQLMRELGFTIRSSPEDSSLVEVERRL